MKLKPNFLNLNPSESYLVIYYNMSLNANLRKFSVCVFIVHLSLLYIAHSLAKKLRCLLIRWFTFGITSSRDWSPKFETDKNGHFTTISSQFSAIYINIFHKTEVQTVHLRCWTGLYHKWFKSYDTNEKTRKNPKNPKITKKTLHKWGLFYKITKTRKRKYLHFVS